MIISEFNTFDIIVLGVIGLSSLIGVIRGFTRESLGIASWIGAIALTLVAIPILRPLSINMIRDPFIADFVGGVITFIISLTLLGIVSRSFAVKVRSSVLGGLDRSLGLVFGFARGVALIVIVFFLYSLVVKHEKWPEGLKVSRSLPYIKKGSHILSQFVPKDAIKNLGIDAEKKKEEVSAISADLLVKTLSAPKPKAHESNGTKDGYDTTELGDMSRLVETSEREKK